MKVRTGLLACALAACAPGAAPAWAAEGCKGGTHGLIVNVTGLASAKGQVVVTLYPDDPRRFLAPGGKLLRVRVKAEAPSVRACLPLAQAGAYAIAVYHDANGDRDFNRTPVGMPAEGFGFSNDPSTRFGLPKFEAVRFQAKPGRGALSVRVRYLRRGEAST